MLFQLLILPLIDISYFIFYYLFNFNHSQTARWFYIHSLGNLVVTYYSSNDVLKCSLYSNSCFYINWNNNSYNSFLISEFIHIYHIIFFKLKKNDYLHHFLMCFICGLSAYYFQSILSTFSTFFLTGLPGMIDYFLLFLVKIGKIDYMTEKKAYIYIITWIRSPGCILVLGYSIPGLYYYILQNELLNFIILFISSLLVFWNGQYYLSLTYHDYYYKNIINYSV